MGGIKWQLLCGVRIELAIGSLPYPGNYLDFQFVSPGWESPLSGLPICKPCLDMRQNPSRDTQFPSYGRRPTKPNQTKVLSNSFAPSRCFFEKNHWTVKNLNPWNLKNLSMGHHFNNPFWPRKLWFLSFSKFGGWQISPTSLCRSSVYVTKTMLRIH